MAGSYQTEFTHCGFRSNFVSKICSSCVGLAIESVPVLAVKLTVMFVMDRPVAVDAPARSALWRICAKPGPSYWLAASFTAMWSWTETSGATREPVHIPSELLPKRNYLLTLRLVCQ